MSIAVEADREISATMNDALLSSLHKFTVEDYHRMIEAGVLNKYSRVQLLEGRIVDKMSRNPPHDQAVVLTQGALAPLLPANWHIRVQSAITTADSEPEPDISVVRGAFAARLYSKRHPHSSDIGMLAEIGDATLRDDQTIQYRIYARARIPVYWIVNLVDEIVEVYTNPKGGKKPRYLERANYTKEESVPLVIAGEHLGMILVRDLLP